MGECRGHGADCTLKRASGLPAGKVKDTGYAAHARAS